MGLIKESLNHDYYENEIKKLAEENKAIKKENRKLKKQVKELKEVSQILKTKVKRYQNILIMNT